MMKKITSKRNALTALSMAVLLPMGAHAANILWDDGGTGSDWSTAENWDGDVAPGSSDFAEIANGNTAYAVGTASFTGGSSDVAGLGVGINGSANGTLTVSGGTLNVGSSGFNVGANNSATGVVNVSGGTINLSQTNNFLGDGTSGTINLTSGTFTAGTRSNFFMANGGGVANFNISGGTLSNMRLLSNVGGTANIAISGSGASIGFENIYTGNGTTALSFVTDAAGVSLLGANTLEFDGNGTQSLVIDVSAYDVSNGTTLSLLNSSWVQFEASDFESMTVIGGTGDFEINDFNGTFGSSLSLTNISVAVPEPATAGLLGLGGLALLIRRRK